MRAATDQTCVFCRTAKATTRDHVPPKGLFAPPRPHLITVPACKNCNGGSNLDDEFMQRLALSAEAEKNQDAQQVCWTVLRAMNKPEKRKMRAGFHRTLTPVNLFSPTGLYLGPTFSFPLDGQRLFRILVKITVGMLWEMTKRKMKRQRISGFSESAVPRFPSNYRVFMHQVGQGPRHEEMLKTERNIPLMLPAHRIGEGTFLYRYLIDGEDPFISVWGFSFYGFFHVVGYTGWDDGTNSHFLALKAPPPQQQQAVCGSSASVPEQPQARTTAAATHS